jgi:hypothetical protein
MNDDQLESDSHLRDELHIAHVVYAATSTGYRLALAVAVSAEYATAVLKEKLPHYLHAAIETRPLPPQEAAGKKHPTFAAWVPDTARDCLAKTGKSSGYYFSEYYYSIRTPEDDNLEALLGPITPENVQGDVVNT